MERIPAQNGTKHTYRETEDKRHCFSQDKTSNSAIRRNSAQKDPARNCNRTIFFLAAWEHEATSSQRVHADLCFYHGIAGSTAASQSLKRMQQWEVAMMIVSKMFSDLINLCSAIEGNCGFAKWHSYKLTPSSESYRHMLFPSDSLTLKRGSRQEFFVVHPCLASCT